MNGNPAKNIDIIDINCVKRLKSVDSIADDFSVFNNIDNVPVFEYPTRSDGFILAICLSGYIDIGINLNRFRLGENHIAVLLPSQILQIFGISDDFSGRFAMMSKKFFNESKLEMESLNKIFFMIQDSPVRLLPDDVKECFMGYYTLLEEKMKIKNVSYKKQIMQHLLVAFSLEISMFLAKVDVPKKNRKEQILHEFLNLVSKNFRNNRNISFYSDKMYLSTKYLSSAIKDSSGRPAGDWIDDYVIVEAKALLRSSDLSIQQITEVLNFADQSFFGKYFKRHTGISPSKYRNSSIAAE